MALEISSGTVKRAQRVVIYGPEGIGKTTLASKFPQPLFVDLEDGTSHIDVNRINWGKKWQEILNTIAEVAKDRNCCKTLVIDTADKAEQLCIAKVCEEKKVSGIEDIGYGKGYTYVGEEFAKILSYLDNVIKVGINVVVVAHAKMRKFEQPDEMGAYDRWELKLSKQAGPLLKEWADMVLFCNYKTRTIKTSNDTIKAQGGKRVIYTSHHPCWDAKNRHGLPDEIDMDYGKISYLFESNTTTFEATAPSKTQPQVEIKKDKLSELMEQDNITDIQILQIVEMKGWVSMNEFTGVKDLPEKVKNTLIKNWNKVKELAVKEGVMFK